MRYSTFACLAVAALVSGVSPKTASAARRRTSRRPATAQVAGPGSVAARRQLAIGYVKRAAREYEKGHYKTVLSLCKQANDLAPTYARSYTWIGAANQKLGHRAAAISAFRWAKALAPGTADAARADRGLRELGDR